MLGAQPLVNIDRKKERGREREIEKEKERESEMIIWDKEKKVT